MIRALFLDDEPLALKQMLIYAEKTPDIEVVGACLSVNDAVKLVGKADVLFTDINMPDMNGLEFVRSMEKPPFIVFTTAHADYAVEGFRVNAVDYLLKPFGLKEFQRSVEKLEYVIGVSALKKTSGPAQVFHFKTGRKTVSVSAEKIRYVEGMSEYIKLHLDGEESPLVVLYNMKRLMEELPAGKFMRIHRSYIVALSRIREAGTTSVTLDSGEILPVSSTYKAALRDYLASGK